MVLLVLMSCEAYSGLEFSQPCHGSRSSPNVIRHLGASRFTGRCATCGEAPRCKERRLGRV